MKKVAAILIYIFFITTQSKIRLISFAYDRPELIPYFYNCLRKNLLDDFEIYIFNDASEDKYEKEIQCECNKLKINCIRVPQSIHKRKEITYRVTDVIRYALQNYGYKHNDIIGLLDGDIFLIDKLNMREMLLKYDIVASMCHDGLTNWDFFWPGMIFFNPVNLPNLKDLFFGTLTILNGNVVSGYTNEVLAKNIFPEIKFHILDAGSGSYFYVKNNPILNIKKAPIFSIYEVMQFLHSNQTSGITNYLISFIENYDVEKLYPIQFTLDYKFLYYTNSSSKTFYGHLANYQYYASELHHQLKTKYICDFLDKILLELEMEDDK